MIKIDKINVYYDKMQNVLKNFSAIFERGKFSVILGPNGAGKSTLLKSIVGYITLDSGTILIDEKKISEWDRISLAKKISLIPQHYSFNFNYTVEELVIMGRFPYLGYWQNYSEEDKKMVEKTLKQLDLYEMKDRFFNKLSGGEKQRVAIARALAQDTDIILMDEAFVNLDINHQLEIMQILVKINKVHNKTIILVSHNINLAAEYCNEIFFIKNGKLAAQGKPENIINKEVLRKIYDTNINVIKNPISGKPNVVYSR